MNDVKGRKKVEKTDFYTAESITVELPPLTYSHIYEPGSRQYDFPG